MRSRLLLLVLLVISAFAARASSDVLDAPRLLQSLDAEDARWIAGNVPLFECPDKELQEIYYLRWHVYREHLKQTPAGWIVTEFLPDVPWAGKYNSISCAAGHHIYEGRWIRNPKYLDDYSRFWFRGGGEPRRYSFWAADAIYAQYLVNLDRAFATDLLPDLVRNYEAWEKDHRDPNGLFWQIDDRDGMEYSLGDSGYRPTINAYMYGDARAIQRLAELSGNAAIATEYARKAAELRRLIEQTLWDPNGQFFKTVPRGKTEPVKVREEIGFVPWYFDLPEDNATYARAWAQITDPQGFGAPFGPPTAERRDPHFGAKVKHDCLWNGPSWPYATTQTLVAMANLLNDYHQDVVSPADYLSLLKNYAKSQYKEGKPHIAEDLDAYTGQWIVDLPRSVDYNHSGYCDLIITGLCGLRPAAPDGAGDIHTVVNPLVPKGAMDWFCLDHIAYHGRTLTIFYDKTGQRYHRGLGLHVLADGNEIARGGLGDKLALHLASATTTAPSADTPSGWKKYAQNPVLGGKLGTCFDVALLKEGSTFRMYFSLRPKHSVALVESTDGIHWSEPQIVLGPNRDSGWEDDINRPVVVKRGHEYHMWYTGQAKGHSAIGYATSPDGKTWQRQSDKPVLSATQPWEKVAIMCPHVMWDEGSKQFRMWYSGGEQYEPDAIGYATSLDGLHWTRHDPNPIFQADPSHEWERHKVTACQVLRHGDWHYMFYIGFRDVNHAAIGLARSRDGITNWERLASNPILAPTPGAWDADACYKPFAIFDGDQWKLWYNGRRGGVEQIGMAIHRGPALWSN
ncbi:MAG TPA: hypothetical protein VGI81_23130 [Tepidisphaeraceae bacterium]